MNKAFVLGSINMDFMISTQSMPKLGETVSGYGFQYTPGGKGANQAVALAKQGIDAYMLGSVGDDIFGEEMIKSLSSFGVKTEFINVISKQSSGTAMIVLENQDNRIITNAGANACHDIALIESILCKYADQGDLLVLQLEIPLDIIEESLNIAKKLGMKTVLNAAPIKPLSEEVLSKTDLLIVNELEANSISLLDFKLHMNESISYLKKLGPKEILVTLGKDGSYFADDNQIIHQPALIVNNVEDTTGAGDTFIGCFLSRLLKGRDIKQALLYATRGSALVIQQKGVHHAIPYEKELGEGGI